MNRYTLLSLFLFLCPTTTYALDIGSPAPDFALKNDAGETIRLSELKGKTVVLEWFNKGCPFVKKHYKAGDMQQLQKEAKEKGTVWLAINSTNADHKDFLNSEARKEVMKEWSIKDATLLTDKDGKVGKMYEAKTTPHMYIIDAKGILVYQGAIDDNSDVFADPKKSANYVKRALSEIEANKPIALAQTKPYGCSVKYAE